MLPYWILFIALAVPALNEYRPPTANGRNKSGVSMTAVVAPIVFLTFVIGTRFKVGGDWNAYIDMYNIISYTEIGEISKRIEIGYVIINKICFELGLGVVGVNVMCAALFSTCLVLFCRAQLAPMLALAVSIPYLVIVVSMGYTRQSVALGFEMLAIVALTKGRMREFVILIMLGATFHRSAVAILPLAAFARAGGSRVLRSFGVIGATAVGYYVFAQDQSDDLIANYVNSNYQSQGAMIRVVMNISAAVVFILFAKRLMFSEIEKRIWRILSIVSIILLILLLLTSSSVGVDRMALYCIPLQIAIFSRLAVTYAESFSSNQIAVRRLATLMIVAVYASVQFIWLNFAANSYNWLPYRSALFED